MALLSSGGRIDIGKMPADELNESFNFLNSYMNVIYSFVMKYYEYMNTRHPYTPEYALTTLEAHLLTDICDYPDYTVTSLANAWNRSISATSQTIRKLMQKGLIHRENSTDDAKVFFLRPTAKGTLVSEAHKRYDTLDTLKTIKRLSHTLAAEEIAAMFKGLEAFNELLARR
jgi:DNA-binding MarR family transcriptional regulator